MGGHKPRKPLAPLSVNLGGDKGILHDPGPAPASARAGVVFRKLRNKTAVLGVRKKAPLSRVLKAKHAATAAQPKSAGQTPNWNFYTACSFFWSTPECGCGPDDWGNYGEGLERPLPSWPTFFQVASRNWQWNKFIDLNAFPYPFTNGWPKATFPPDFVAADQLINLGPQANDPKTLVNYLVGQAPDNMWIRPYFSGFRNPTWLGEQGKIVIAYDDDTDQGWVKWFTIQNTGPSVPDAAVSFGVCLKPGVLHQKEVLLEPGSYTCRAFYTEPLYGAFAGAGPMSAPVDVW